MLIKRPSYNLSINVAEAYLMKKRIDTVLEDFVKNEFDNLPDNYKNKKNEERLYEELEFFSYKGATDFLFDLMKTTNEARSGGKYYLLLERGLVPNSLVLYLMGISIIDPIKYDLSFDLFKKHYENRNLVFVFSSTKHIKPVEKYDHSCVFVYYSPLDLLDRININRDTNFYLNERLFNDVLLDSSFVSDSFSFAGIPVFSSKIFARELKMYKDTHGTKNILENLYKVYAMSAAVQTLDFDPYDSDIFTADDYYQTFFKESDKYLMTKGQAIAETNILLNIVLNKIYCPTIFYDEAINLYKSMTTKRLYPKKFIDSICVEQKEFYSLIGINRKEILNGNNE